MDFINSKGSDMKRIPVPDEEIVKLLSRKGSGPY